MTKSSVIASLHRIPLRTLAISFVIYLLYVVLGFIILFTFFFVCLLLLTLLAAEMNRVFDVMRAKLSHVDRVY